MKKCLELENVYYNIKQKIKSQNTCMRGHHLCLNIHDDSHLPILTPWSGKRKKMKGEKDH